jgi:hypothetical protein
MKRRSAALKAGKLDDARAENDSEEREFVLTAIDYFVKQSIGHVQAIARELPMLQRMAAESQRDTRMTSSASASAAAAASKPEVFRVTDAAGLVGLPPRIADRILFKSADGSLQSVSVLNTIQKAIDLKTNVRDRVFREPNPPTMSMDEALELDRKSGKILPKKTEPYAHTHPSPTRGQLPVSYPPIRLYRCCCCCCCVQ